MPSQSQLRYILDVRVSGEGTTIVRNTASVRSSATDPNPQNNTVTVRTDVLIIF